MVAAPCTQAVMSTKASDLCTHGFHWKQSQCLEKVPCLPQCSSSCTSIIYLPLMSCKLICAIHIYAVVATADLIEISNNLNLPLHNNLCNLPAVCLTSRRPDIFMWCFLPFSSGSRPFLVCGPLPSPSPSHGPCHSIKKQSQTLFNIKC